MLQKTPWAPKQKVKPRPWRLAKDRQKALIGQVADALRDNGQPTAFRWSASFRHGLRSGLCLVGWPWLVADLTAAAVIERALRRLGATRPRWIEGQRSYTGYAPFCANEQCGRPMPRGRPDRMFCCNDCRKSAKNFRYRCEHRAEAAARMMAARIVAREKGPTRTCEWCQRSFKALDYTGKKPQRFCGLKCRSAYASSFAAGWRPRLLDKGRRAGNGNGHMNGKPEAPQSGEKLLGNSPDNLDNGYQGDLPINDGINPR